MRILYMALGLVCVVVGGIGVFVPGLPTTVFFIIAAWAFARSSPRLEAWVLDLPGIGPAVSDYREGLGMPRRAKILASAMLIGAVTASTVLFLNSWAIRGIVVAVGAVGLYWILVRVPTRERVLGG